MGLAISKMWTCNIQFALIFNQLLILHSVSWRNVQLKKKKAQICRLKQHILTLKIELGIWEHQKGSLDSL